ncbi:MAG TPA: acyloxyacyl hydrolase [Terracidiphilus sp.]|nr:acyloxyacyl hydrolase [Terracidiphilus sp.]
MAGAAAQSGADSSHGSPYYARKNSFGLLAAFSPDSSHILLGGAENRMLLNIGGSYSRRLFLNRIVDWQYDAELLPAALESDPVSTSVNNQTSPSTATFTNDDGPILSCATYTAQYSFVYGGVTYAGTETISCNGRRWTIGEAMSPIGFQWNFRPRHKTQPFFVGHGGYMYSTEPIPVAAAGSFNFTFDLGVGVEVFRSHTRSIRGEFRYHHISNHGTASFNPGIDNLMYQVSYVFGR